MSNKSLSEPRSNAKNLYPNLPSFGTSKMPQEKYRRLPCKTFICVGSCPYRDRCCYVHDSRIARFDVFVSD
jgi:hypothetical protein